MVFSALDKMVFATLLLVLFQVPLLEDHYLQFLNGYYSSVKAQVDGYKLNASMHEYSDVHAMIEDFKRNPNAAVRADAQQKEKTLLEYKGLRKGIRILKEGNIVERSIYMFSPERWEVLREVFKNFQPGIPLNLLSIVYSAGGALLLGAMLMWPVRKIGRWKSGRANDV